MTVSPTERQYILSQVNVLAAEQISLLWSHAEALTDINFAAFVRQAFPDVVTPFAVTASDLAANWYDETPSPTNYIAKPGPLPDPHQLESSADWALGANGRDAIARMQGTAQRAIFDSARDTTLYNVEHEPGSKWARHASANACVWCRMMSTRGAVFHTRKSAMKSHDFCHCVAIEVRPGGLRYSPPAYVQDWNDQYQKARADAGSGDPKAIQASWRRLLAAGT
jgi:hypothetical protein